GAKDKPTITFKAPVAEDERPLASEILVGPEGSDFAFRVDFNKVPWGDTCKNRCANTTIFLDTDNSTATGLQLPDKKAPETGADLSLTIQGAREYKDTSADVLLKVKVREYSDSARTVDDGETLAELDHRRDPERVQVDEKTVYVLDH